MGEGRTLRQNVAPWDRWMRAIVAATLILGSPAVVRGPLWLTILGAIGGGQLVAAITGY